MKSTTVTVEIDAEDVVTSPDDAELAACGLMRAPDEIKARHESLFQAVERGDCNAAFAAAEQIADLMYGRILVARRAA